MIPNTLFQALAKPAELSRIEPDLDQYKLCLVVDQKFGTLDTGVDRLYGVTGFIGMPCYRVV